VSSAHIADHCPSSSRTLEMVLLDLWLTLGYMVGSLLSGYALKNLGYTNPVLGYAVPILCVAIMQVLLDYFNVRDVDGGRLGRGGGGRGGGVGRGGRMGWLSGYAVKNLGYTNPVL
jgi:hypothetical protein